MLMSPLQMQVPGMLMGLFYECVTNRPIVDVEEIPRTPMGLFYECVTNRPIADVEEIPRTPMGLLYECEDACPHICDGFWPNTIEGPKAERS